MESTIKELIKKSVEENYKESAGIDKKKFEEVLTGMVEKGACLKDAVGLSDDFMNQIYSYAYNLFQGGKYEKASDAFETLRMFNPRNPVYTFGLAACKHKLLQYQEAAIYYMCAAGINNNDPVAYYHASDCFMKLGNKYGALFMLTHALSHLKNTPENAVFKERLEQSIKSLGNQMKKEEKTS
jgi:type III secretion system low calcium response chaperone LcrH/SycD